MARILVVDQDSRTRELIRMTLGCEGLACIGAADAAAALEVMRRQHADLAVIDGGLPGEEGWRLCEELRRTSDMPLLVLAAQGELPYKVKAFKAGADDYVLKPFEPLELLLRIRALLRRSRIASSQTIVIGRTEINRREYEVKCGDRCLPLRSKEFDLLFKLASYPDRIFTREQLIEQIWGADYVGDMRTVDVHIKRLREQVHAMSGCIRIMTVRGLGYRLQVRG
ncbi:winged helix-turn-helix domain-containing protein [Paenibacillus sp. S-38]|uniref:winged helix-turn-helix domain-containing protein n=1 Tax=Paenibacillus sp. S-38 TaxID=3416710 RepID=UPI003CF00384